MGYSMGEEISIGMAIHSPDNGEAPYMVGFGWFRSAGIICFVRGHLKSTLRPYAGVLPGNCSCFLGTKLSCIFSPIYQRSASILAKGGILQCYKR